jgi:hypothetical protein
MKRKKKPPDKDVGARLTEIGVPKNIIHKSPHAMYLFFERKGVLIWRSKPHPSLPRAAIAMLKKNGQHAIIAAAYQE